MDLYLPHFFLFYTENFFIPTIYFFGAGQIPFKDRLRGIFMVIIPTLVLGYCAIKLYGIYKKSSTISRKPTTISYKAEPNRVEQLHKRIRENQKWALENMGPEGSLDPMAKYYAQERVEMIKPGAENDPEVVAIRKMIQEKRQQSVEARWNQTI